MTWQPGESGNPAGRKPGNNQFKRLAKGANPEAIAELRKLITSKKNPALRLKAIRELFDRTLGKPAQATAPFFKINPKPAAVFDAGQESTVIIVPAPKAEAGPREEISIEALADEIADEVAEMATQELAAAMAGPARPGRSTSRWLRHRR